MPHYFDDAPESGSQPAHITVDLGDLRFEMLTDRGVFSHGSLDRGTRLLLTRVPAPPAGERLLDLGCGAGVVALAMAQRAPTSEVWAVDVNERARTLCGTNAAALGLDNVRVAHPDEVDRDLRFTTIWSNPPIRIGKERLHSLLSTWLDRLDETGDAWLVVQRHLGADSLHRWLEQHGYVTERAASQAGYRVLHVTASAARRIDGDPQP